MDEFNELKEEKKDIVEKEEISNDVSIDSKNDENKEKVEEIEKKSEEKQKVDDEILNKNSKKSIKKVIIFIIILIFLLFFSTIFAVCNLNNNYIIDGVYINEINISGLSSENLQKLLDEKSSNIKIIELYFQEYNTDIEVENIELKLDYKDIIESAIKYGKSGNILVDNYAILYAKIFNKRYDLNINWNEEKLNNNISKIQYELPDKIIDYSYEIVEEELIITPGQGGNLIENEKLKTRIKNNIKEQFLGKYDKIEIPVTYENPKQIDIDSIYLEVHKEAVNAYIEEDPFVLHKDENGIDFNISLDEAKKIVKEENKSYKIPLKITEAEVKVKDLGDKIFRENLAKYTTIYDAGNKNRATNIEIAAKALNNTIVLPGEIFSYNGTIGNATKEKGYQLGASYVGGKVVQSYGGGICQLSTTLYNAVVYANLEIIERDNHSYDVSYVPTGRDATVAYGATDFKFKNTRSYPIKIISTAKNGVVSSIISGIKEEVEYDIEIKSSVLSSIPNKVIYENTDTLYEGEQKVIEKGFNGCRSITYKITKYNGNIIKKEVLSKDKYNAMNKVIQVGTKKVEKQETKISEQDNIQENNIENIQNN